jgi:hypothetical protein
MDFVFEICNNDQDQILNPVNTNILENKINKNICQFDNQSLEE